MYKRGEQSLQSLKVPALRVIHHIKACWVLDHNYHSPTSSKTGSVAQREGKSPAMPNLAFFLSAFSFSMNLILKPAMGEQPTAGSQVEAAEQHRENHCKCLFHSFL